MASQFQSNQTPTLDVCAHVNDEYDMKCGPLRHPRARKRREALPRAVQAHAARHDRNHPQWRHGAPVRRQPRECVFSSDYFLPFVLSLIRERIPHCRGGTLLGGRAFPVPRVLYSVITACFSSSFFFFFLASISRSTPGRSLSAVDDCMAMVWLEESYNLHRGSKEWRDCFSSWGRSGVICLRAWSR